MYASILLVAGAAPNPSWDPQNLCTSSWLLETRLRCLGRPSGCTAATWVTPLMLTLYRWPHRQQQPRRGRPQGGPSVQTFLYSNCFLFLQFKKKTGSPSLLVINASEYLKTVVKSCLSFLLSKLNNLSPCNLSWQNLRPICRGKAKQNHLMGEASYLQPRLCV